jgi:hypothetical protein
MDDDEVLTNNNSFPENGVISPLWPTPTLAPQADADGTTDPSPADDNNNNNDPPPTTTTTTTTTTTMTWSARNSFTADSPYFAAFCQSEFKSVNNLTTTLRDISNRTKTFCQAGAILSEATQRLAQSCRLAVVVEDGFLETNTGSSSSSMGGEDPAVVQERLVQQRKKAVGEEMAALLELLGEVCGVL